MAATTEREYKVVEGWYRLSGEAQRRAHLIFCEREQSWIKEI